MKKSADRLSTDGTNLAQMCRLFLVLLTGEWTSLARQFTNAVLVITYTTHHSYTPFPRRLHFHLLLILVYRRRKSTIKANNWLPHVHGFSSCVSPPSARYTRHLRRTAQDRTRVGRPRDDHGGRWTISHGHGRRAMNDRRWTGPPTSAAARAIPHPHHKPANWVRGGHTGPPSAF